MIVINTCTLSHLVLYELRDFLQVLQQMVFFFRGFLQTRVQLGSAAVTAERRPKHLLVLEQVGSVEMQLWVTGGGSVDLLLQDGESSRT